MDYKKRIGTLRGKMEERGLSGMFVGADASWEYLSGAKRIGRDRSPKGTSALHAVHGILRAGMPLLSRP